jgi:hypothetical protein
VPGLPFQQRTCRAERTGIAHLADGLLVPGASSKHRALCLPGAVHVPRALHLLILLRLTNTVFACTIWASPGLYCSHTTCQSSRYSSRNRKSQPLGSAILNLFSPGVR